MNAFEYVIILTSLIIGLGVTQILVGVSNLITNKDIKYSIPHAMMTLLIFLTQIQEWWVTYQYSMLEGFWTLPLVMLLMVFPILLFVASRVLFPYEEIDDKAVDLDAYYWKKWPALYLIFFIMAITSILQNYLFLDLPPTEQFLQIALALLYLIFLVFKIKNRYAHIAFLSMQLIGWVIFLVLEDSVIG